MSDIPNAFSSFAMCAFLQLLLAIAVCSSATLAEDNFALRSEAHPSLLRSEHVGTRAGDSNDGAASGNEEHSLDDRERSPSESYSSCAVSSIFALLRQRGQVTTPSEIERRLKANNPHYDPRAASAVEIITVLASYGLQSECVRTTTFHLPRLPTPAIMYLPPSKVHRDIGHFCVLAKTDKNAVLISDYAFDSREHRVKLSDLNKFWDGDLIVVSAQPAPYVTKSEIVLTLGFLVSLVALLALYFRFFARVRTDGAQATP